MSLSTHVLDTSLGRPAAGVSVSLAQLDGTVWVVVMQCCTDHDGRVKSLVPEGVRLDHATLRLRFETAPYFAAVGQQSMYPYVDITFTMDDEGHYHVPLLLTANGYSTYRGS